MSIIERLENIREREGLNKSQFERKLSKSTGYINMLVKRNSNPGVDVIETFAKEFPHYSLEWLMTGEGEMLKEGEDQSSGKELIRQNPELDLLTVRNEIRSDLKIMLDGMTKNFEVINDGILMGLRGQQKILKFIDQLNADEITRASSRLDEFLKQQQ